MRALVAAASIAACLTAGCGSSSDELPPAAEPAHSPPPASRPAGRVVHVGHEPEGLVYDERTGLLAVALKGPDRLAIVEGGSGRVIRRVSLPGSARHLALARPGGPVLVPAESADALVEVSLPRGRTRVTHVGRQPHDATPAAGRVFVGNELGNTVSVVQHGKDVATLAAPIQPGGVASTDGGRRVAVVGVKERALRLYEAATLRSIGRIDVGIGPTHLVGIGDRLFVVDTRGNALLEVRTAPTLRIHRRTELEGTPYGIAVDRRRNRLWVTLTATDRVVELKEGKVLRSFPTVRQPNSVAVDERTGRVFVASRSDGNLQLLDP